MTTVTRDAGVQQKRPALLHQSGTNNMLEILGEAVDAHRSRQWQMAETLYRQVLEIDATQANANHNLGILALDADQVNESLDYFKIALANDPDEPQFWVSYVDALIRAKQTDVARAVLIEGLERGLHGDEVNALVDRLTQASLPQAANVESDKEVDSDHTEVTSANVTANEIAMDDCHQQIGQSAHYLSHPQIKQAFEWMQMGKLDLAKGRFKKLQRYFPNHAFILAALGVIALQQVNTKEGVDLLEQSLRIDPKQTTTLSSLGIAYTTLAQYEKAIACCSKAISLNPQYAEAYVNRANAYQASERFKEAIQDYLYAAELKPSDANIFFNLGLTYRHLNDCSLAAGYFKKAVELDPNDVVAIEHCSESYAMLKQYQVAMPYIEQSIAMNPGNINNYIRRGAVNLNLGNLAQATADLEYAIQQAPDNAAAYINSALVHRKRNQHQLALDTVNIALKLLPDNANTYLNRGLIHVEMHEFEQAEADYERGIQLDPRNEDLYWNLAILHLLRGEYQQGWQLYEWRWQSILKVAKREYVQPLWLGEQPIAGKTVLIYAEQGLGDFIQFCRYIPMLESLGAKVILETPKALTQVISSLPGNHTVIEAGSTMPSFDFQCPIMSLPLAFKTTLETIPSKTPYLQADPKKIQIWQAKLGEKTKLRIGLVWSGSLGHTNDHNRSLTLEMLQPILSLDVEFHVLQKEIRAADAVAVQQVSSLTVHSDDLQDFSDTAALIEVMDLVISVDTSVAHLAGALNKPCWVLLPYAPDFRWLLDHEESPWYPVIRLFRQQKDRDWTRVILEINAAIQAEIAS